MTDQFSPEERAALSPYFTNLDGPVFALVNLPEVVKGALFARYSRSPKSLRRLFLDEFLGPGGLAATAGHGGAQGDAGARRAEQLFERVFVEYGDDSVAQLGGVHLACEGSSNILTKVLEWGRLMAYLEQSTRYIPYDDRPDGRYRYHVPAELTGALRERYVATLDRSFDVYRAWLPKLRAFFEAKFPRDPAESEAVHRMTIRAKALDTLRRLLPAAALYAVSSRPDAELLEIARRMTLEERSAVLAAYVGKRLNRRHRPGRAFERTSYRFDVLGDYGAFRDLQRHRLLTLEWQRLTPAHGYVMPAALVEAGAADDFRRVMDDAAALHDAVEAAGMPEVASYAVSMAYRVRFYMAMNARDAMHLIELRSAPQGHASYRRVAQTMHRLIAERAGHRALAAAMTFADHSVVDLERLEAERAAERRRAGR